MSNYPPAVEKMVTALDEFKGVSDIEVGLQAIDEIEIENLSLPAHFAMLPHLAIRRSEGGKPNEALISFDFKLSKDNHGWVALEFIAWWVRDMCRSDHEIQLRPQALPPSAGDAIQLGSSLTFTLEIFYVEPDDDPMKIAEYVGECGDSLQSSIEIYSNEIKAALPKKSFFK